MERQTTRDLTRDVEEFQEMVHALRQSPGFRYGGFWNSGVDHEFGQLVNAVETCKCYGLFQHSSLAHLKWALERERDRRLSFKDSLGRYTTEKKWIGLMYQTAIRAVTRLYHVNCGTSFLDSQTEESLSIRGMLDDALAVWEVIEHSSDSFWSPITINRKEDDPEYADVLMLVRDVFTPFPVFRPEHRLIPLEENQIIRHYLRDLLGLAGVVELSDNDRHFFVVSEEVVIQEGEIHHLITEDDVDERASQDWREDLEND